MGEEPATATATASAIPIDVVFSKLADWLVDRKRIPHDWRKRLLAIRSKIASAFATLPKDLNPWFATLTIDDVGYLEAKKILGILTVEKPEARTLFGRLSGVAGDWDTIVRAYEKDFLYLGEATQIMVQYVNYEIPYLKKQTTKLHQQLADLERKEAEYKRNATAAASKYLQACQELGVKGTNIKFELLETSKNLHAIFAEVNKVLCDEIIGQAVDCYQTFVSYTSGSDNGKSELVVPNLMKFRVKHSKNLMSGKDASNAPLFTSDVQQKVEAENQECLPSNISLSTAEENAVVDIELEVNTVEKSSQPQEDKVFQGQHPMESLGVDTEENGRQKDESMDNLQGDVDSNSKEIRETGETEIQWDIGDSDTIFSGDTLESEINWDNGNADTALSGESFIDWDISIEDGIGIDTDVQSLLSETHSPTIAQEPVVIENELMETEFRNNLLDDLLEIRTFLVLRMEEINRAETSSLQNQVQAICPGTLQQYGSDSFNMMCSEISKAIGLLTNKRNRDLIMIVTSERFLSRLEASLTQKKQQESKLLENVREIHQKQSELRNTLAAIWPKQEAALRRTREIKENSEKIVSSLYEGRKINLIGEINSVLRQA